MADLKIGDRVGARTPFQDCWKRRQLPFEMTDDGGKMRQCLHCGFYLKTDRNGVVTGITGSSINHM